MTQVIEATDARSGAIPYGSRDSLAVVLLRQILQHMQKVNTRYNAYSQPGPTTNSDDIQEKQVLIQNPYRAVLQMQAVHTAFSHFDHTFMLLENGPLHTIDLPPENGQPIIKRAIVVLNRNNINSQGFIDFNVAPINPVTIVSQIIGF